MKKGLAAGILLLALGVVPGIVFAQNAQEEVDKQISKAISDAINARVTTSTAAEVASAPPNNFWAGLGQTTIESSSFDLSVPVLMAGFDRDVRGKAMTGASVAFYSFSDAIGGVQTDFYGFNVSPYFAYIFSRNYFLTAKVNLGSSYSESSRQTTTQTFSGGTTTTTNSSFSSDTTTFSYGLDAAFNVLFRPGNERFLIKGLARIGYSASESETYTFQSSSTTLSPCPAFGPCSFFSAGSTTTTASSDSIPYGVEGEFGMFFAPKSYGFVGVQYQDSDQPNSNAVYGRLGYEQQFGRAAALGVKYETRLSGDGDIDVSSIFVTFRMGFGR